MKETKYTRKQIIFKEGDEPDCIYFIKKGEIEVEKIILPIFNFSQLQKNVEKDREDNFEDSFFIKKNEVTNIHKGKNWHRPKAMGV